MALKTEKTSIANNATEEAITAPEIETKQNENTYYKLFVYIGPTLPNGKLKSNTVLQGDFESICNNLKDVIAELPQIKHLIVPIHRMAEQKNKAKTKGNIINKYCNDVVSTISK